MSAPTIMTTHRDAIHAWRVAFAHRWALQDPSFTSVREIGTRAWRNFWGQIYERDLPKAGLRNPLRSSWYTRLMTRATADDLDTLRQFFTEPCEGDRGSSYGKAFYQFLINELVRATYTEFTEGRPSSPAMADWCRAAGWGVPEDWVSEPKASGRGDSDKHGASAGADGTSPVVDRSASTGASPVVAGAAGGASDPIATARAAMAAAGIPPAAIEVALAAAAAEKEAYEAAAAAAEAVCAAASAEILERAADPQLAAFNEEVAAMEAIADRQARASTMCDLLHHWVDRAPTLATNPPLRSAVAAFCRRCASDVYFSHCYLSVAEEMEDVLWRSQHPDVVA